MIGRNDPLISCTGFDWDDANKKKNWNLHQVTAEEAEELFFNVPIIVRSDVGHSGKEKRYYALGRTDRSRYLFVAFTIRRNTIRVISVRDMNRRERTLYARQEENS